MQPNQPILVPIDFSEGANHALRLALEIANATGAKLHLLHAYVLPVFPTPEGAAAVSQLVDEWMRDAEKQLHHLAEPYRASGVLGSVQLKVGDPRAVIVETARELKAGLIVMGTHGRRGFTRFLLGSVAEAIVRTAPCPVLTVPGSVEATPAV